MGKSGIDGLHALTDAYRALRAEPTRCATSPRHGCPGDEATRREGRRVGEAGYAVLASFGLTDGRVARGHRPTGGAGPRLRQPRAGCRPSTGSPIPTRPSTGLVELFAAGDRDAVPPATKQRPRRERGARS